jgi:hypothetical protein
MFDYEDRKPIPVKPNLVYVWMVVLKSDEGKSISKFSEAEHVLNAIGQMKNVEVLRVFTVDEFGIVQHYDVVFKGKLRLEVVL